MDSHNVCLTTNGHHNALVAVSESQDDCDVEGQKVPDQTGLASRRTQEFKSRIAEAVEYSGGGNCFHCSNETIPPIHANAIVEYYHPVTQLALNPAVVYIVQPSDSVQC